jgi:hypothetical protein
MEVPPYNDPGDENFDATNARLTDGLKSCRAVLSNYRTLLAGDDDQHSKRGFDETDESREWGGD